MALFILIYVAKQNGHHFDRTFKVLRNQFVILGRLFTFAVPTGHN